VELRDAVVKALLLLLYVGAVYVIWAIVRINKDEPDEEE
jgi:hypothetical protein